MGNGFTSTFHHKVDSKGRVSVPAGFRRALDADAGAGESATELLLLPSFEKLNCLEAYQPSYLRKIQEGINRMKPGSPRRRWVERKVNAPLITLPLDPAGRVILGPTLREKYGFAFGENVVFCGLGQTFQIWSENEFNAFDDAFDDAPPPPDEEVEDSPLLMVPLDWDDAPEAAA